MKYQSILIVFETKVLTAGFYVTEKSITETFSFVSSLHQTSNIDHIQKGGHFASWFISFTEKVKERIFKVI